MAVLSLTTSSSPSQRLMTTVATPLPTRLVSARHSLMNLSMPSRMASDWIGMSGTIARVAASVTNPAPVTPEAPLDRDHGDGQNPELLAKPKRRVRRLREKQCRQRHIDVGAVEIEAVAGRDDEPDDRFGGAEALHLLDHVGQHGLRGARAEHDQQFVLDVSEEAQDREPGETSDGAEHNENEEQTREIKRRDQLDQVHQRDHAIGTHGKGHGPQGPDRRRAYDDADHAEEDFAMASITALIRSPRSPRCEMAKPVRIETSRICRRSPLAKAPMKVSGMIASRWATMPSSLARRT